MEVGNVLLCLYSVYELLPAGLGLTAVEGEPGCAVGTDGRPRCLRQEYLDDESLCKPHVEEAREVLRGLGHTWQSYNPMEPNIRVDFRHARATAISSTRRLHKCKQQLDLKRNKTAQLRCDIEVRRQIAEVKKDCEVSELERTSDFQDRVMRLQDDADLNCTRTLEERLRVEVSGHVQELAEQEGDHKLALDDLDRRLREQCAQRLDRAANLCQKDTALKLRQQKNRCPFNWQDLLDSSKHQAQFHRREHARLRTEHESHLEAERVCTEKLQGLLEAAAAAAAAADTTSTTSTPNTSDKPAQPTKCPPADYSQYVKRSYADRLRVNASRLSTQLKMLKVRLTDCRLDALVPEHHQELASPETDDDAISVVHLAGISTSSVLLLLLLLVGAVCLRLLAQNCLLNDRYLVACRALADASKRDMVDVMVGVQQQTVQRRREFRSWRLNSALTWLRKNCFPSKLGLGEFYQPGPSNQSAAAPPEVSAAVGPAAVAATDATPLTAQPDGRGRRRRPRLAKLLRRMFPCAGRTDEQSQRDLEMAERRKKEKDADTHPVARQQQPQTPPPQQHPQPRKEEQQPQAQQQQQQPQHDEVEDPREKRYAEGVVVEHRRSTVLYAPLPHDAATEEALDAVDSTLQRAAILNLIDLASEEENEVGEEKKD